MGGKAGAGERVASVVHTLLVNTLEPSTRGTWPITLVVASMCVSGTYFCLFPLRLSSFTRGTILIVPGRKGLCTQRVRIRFKINMSYLWSSIRGASYDLVKNRCVCNRFSLTVVCAHWVLGDAEAVKLSECMYGYYISRCTKVIHYIDVLASDT